MGDFSSSHLMPRVYHTRHMGASLRRPWDRPNRPTAGGIMSKVVIVGGGLATRPSRQRDRMEKTYLFGIVLLRTKTRCPVK